MKKTIILSTLILNFFSLNSQWILQSDQFGRPVTKVYFHDGSRGWLSVAGFYVTGGSIGNFAVTYNGGTNWSAVLPGCTAFFDFIFVNENTGWLAGTCFSDTGPSTGNLYKSTNGGLNFVLQKSETGTGYNALYFINENTGWLGTSGSKIYKTVNSGGLWSLVYDSTGYLNYSKLYFMDTDTGYMVKNSGILKTNNSGANWVYKHLTPGMDEINSIVFVSENSGFACGQIGVILKSTDFGETWFNQISNVSGNLRALSFINETTGYAGGDGGLILRTTDGGITWVNTNSSISSNLNSIHFIDLNTGWSAGGFTVGTYNDGKIYKTTNGGNPIGIEIISTEIPDQFSLSQNYPNPFNPSTKIKFAIPLSRGVSEGLGVFTKLLIYDMLGREIAVLVNEQLSPGIYEVNWNAGSYTSGVYFYKLQAGDFAETKKMVLVK